MWKKIFKSTIIIFCLLFTMTIIYDYISDYFTKKNEEKRIANYFINTVNEERTEEKEVSKDKDEFIAVLEIPSISLKKGLYKKTSIYNDIKYNIEILKSSDTPEGSGDVILAAHSGNSKISFFKHLYKLNISDEVNIYYKSAKYKYIVDEIFEEQKKGDIVLSSSNDKRLILTTCSKDKTKQTIIICILKDVIK